LTEDSSSFTTSGLSGGTYTVGHGLSAASRPVLTGNIRFQVLSSDLLELLDGVIVSVDQQT